VRRPIHLAVLFVPVLLAACTDAPRLTTPADARREELEAQAAGGARGDSLPWIDETELRLFRRGRYLFQKRFTPSKGLGPTFNARSCAECHGGDEGGGVFHDARNRLETHFTRLNADGSCSSLAIHGGFVRQDSATKALEPYFTTEPLPSGQHQTAQRITPDLLGFGLIAAIPKAAILARADPNDADGDGISGRANMVGGLVGRFGRKAAGNDLDSFNAGALLNEMGITNPLFMQENLVGSDTVGGSTIPDSVDPILESDSLELDGGDLASLNAFIRFLAAPPPLPPDTAGETLFNSTGCTRCHASQEYTTASAIHTLDQQKVRPFSDFLLHDMGPQLSPHQGDICLADAGRTEFRTEPLMGARFMHAFMHDGIAATIDQAILQHGGEADSARAAYGKLSAAQRQALIAYINTL
jgi:CxxC motif-containing protein (DUF1111 family)